MRLTPVSCLLALSLSTTAVADETLDQARALLDQKQPVRAVELLAPLEDTRGGEPAYDYLLGLAHLDAGEPSQAVFAFERCLAVDPRHGLCRLQMARTHLAMGERANARTELETIQAHEPPPEVQALVNEYLGAVARQAERAKRQTSGFVQFGAGYDSNVNSATDQSRIALPAFNNALFTVASGSRRQDSLLLQGQLSGSYVRKVNAALTTIAEGGVQFRSYQDVSDYSYLAADLAGGGAYQHGQGQLIGKVQLQGLWLGGEHYRDSIGLLGQYQYSLASDNQLSAYVQLGRLRYDLQSSRDANRLTLGAAWSRAFEVGYHPVVYASAYAGQENTTDSAADAFSHDTRGLRAGGSLTLTERLKLNAGLSLEQRDYQAVYFPFNTTRDDDELSFTLGAAWRLGTGAAFVPSYSFVRNSSNIPVTDYDRHVVSLDLRFDL